MNMTSKGGRVLHSGLFAHRVALRRAAGIASLGFLLALAPMAAAQTACDADLNGDSAVGPEDLALLLAAWGSCASCGADIDGNATVNSADLAAVLAAWGEICADLPWATVIRSDPDPAVVTSAELRKRISATGLPWHVVDNATQIELRLIPPGTFDMGCSQSVNSDCAMDEYPVHAVTLTNPFYIGRYEVTQQQWGSVIPEDPSGIDGNDHPVDSLTWEHAQQFLAKSGFRLPTEAEWEYSYRAGTTTAYHSFSGAPNGTDADALLSAIAWWNVSLTQPVGGKEPNGFGLYDMSGNVWEWVSDWYSSTYYANSPSVNPQGPATGQFKVARGGSWGDGPALISTWRASERDPMRIDLAYKLHGFRVARNP